MKNPREVNPFVIGWILGLGRGDSDAELLAEAKGIEEKEKERGGCGRGGQHLVFIMKEKPRVGERVRGPFPFPLPPLSFSEERTRVHPVSHFDHTYPALRTHPATHPPPAPFPCFSHPV